MDNKRGKNLLVILEAFVIFVLVILLVLSWVGVFNINKGNVEDENIADNISNNNGENNNYKEYKKYDEITLSNDTKWVVIKDSNKNQDYVTLLSKELFDFQENLPEVDYDERYFVLVSEDEWIRLDNELYADTYVTYDNYILKKIFEERVIKKIPVNLKEVDGYKIRLITIDEALSLDGNWSYDKENDIYNYTGNKIANYLNNTLTMTRPKTALEFRKSSLCSIYTNNIFDENATFLRDETMIAPYAPYVHQKIRPVINVYKNELN